MTRTYGRIDYRPRLSVWRVVTYHGQSERVLSDHPSYAAAADALRAYVVARAAGRSVAA